MRRTLASTLLLSSLLLPALAKAASPPVDDASAPAPHRVTTGVVAPVLLNSTGIVLPSGISLNTIPIDSQFALSLVVDQDGRPQNVQVVKGISPFWDARVVNAVRKFRYRPATIDNRPVPMGLNLIVNFTR